MATKKDLVEAHAFSRRRLVTAFVSGAPGGREVEPVRPGRVLIGGVALSVLLLAGAAIAGFLLGRPPAQWLDEGSFGEQFNRIGAGLAVLVAAPLEHLSLLPSRQERVRDDDHDRPQHPGDRRRHHRNRVAGGGRTRPYAGRLLPQPSGLARDPETLLQNGVMQRQQKNADEISVMFEEVKLGL